MSGSRFPYALLLIPIGITAAAVAFNRTDRRAIIGAIVKTSLFATAMFGITLAIDLRSGSGSFNIVPIVLGFGLVVGPPLGVLAWWARKRRERRAMM